MAKTIASTHSGADAIAPILLVAVADAGRALAVIERLCAGGERILRVLCRDDESATVAARLGDSVTVAPLVWSRELLRLVRCGGFREVVFLVESPARAAPRLGMVMAVRYPGLTVWHYDSLLQRRRVTPLRWLACAAADGLERCGDRALFAVFRAMGRRRQVPKPPQG